MHNLSTAGNHMMTAILTSYLEINYKFHLHKPIKTSIRWGFTAKLSVRINLTSCFLHLNAFVRREMINKF